MDILIILSSIIFVRVLAKYRIDITTAAVIISYAVNYAVYVLSIGVTGTMLWLIYKPGQRNQLFVTVLILLFQLLLAYLPFTLKRLKNGLSFLQKKENSGIGLLISGIILFFSALLRTNFSNTLNYLFFTFGTVVCIFGIIFWWRNNLTKSYLEKNTKRQLDELNKLIADQTKLITELTKENERLSSLIHRDNKIIPAMGMAVRKYIGQSDQKFSDDSQEGEAIMKQLECLMKDRYEAIAKAKNLSKVLPNVNVDSINGVFQYMYLRAAQHNIDYDVIVVCSIKYLIENAITELELSTILSDLIENAIHATKSSDFKKIIVTIAVHNNFYEIDVQDSGVMFEAEILRKIGQKRVTNHKENGGSGIGLMTLFEILKKRKASLIITEYPPKTNSLSKSIKIRFDGQNECLIYSFRADQLKKAISREDLVFLPADA